jgi:hypothetical protein
MAITIDREALAWAAGFFDGEGNIRYDDGRRAGKTDRSNVTLQVQQIDPEVLHRFQRAVGGIGTVYGPYRRFDSRTGKEHSLQWQFSIQRYDQAQAAIVMLWPFLSSIKRAQAHDALKRARDSWRRKPKTSNHVGVDYVKNRGKWRARRPVHGVICELGLHATEELAADAVKNGRCRHGNAHG